MDNNANQYVLNAIEGRILAIYKANHIIPNLYFVNHDTVGHLQIHNHHERVSQ